MHVYIINFIISKQIWETWFIESMVNVQFHFLAHEMETTLSLLPYVPPFHTSITTKAEPFILQKVYQRTNYNIKWGGVQNSLNDK